MTTFSERHRFADWPNRDIPAVAVGVYVIWDGDQLVYCGMPGRGYADAVASSVPRYGMVTRLAAHASGRLSGNQFAVYVANRLVIPSLTTDQQALFASGSLTLASLPKTYIRERLSYQVALVSSTVEAYELERNAGAA